MAPGIKGGYRQINKALNVCVFEDYLESQHLNLPKLLDVEQISPRVLRVLGQNPGKFTLQGTNTYIVGTGRERLIIDTGQGAKEWADLIASTLADQGFKLSHVLITHFHNDHCRGVPDLLRLYPELSTSIYKNTPDRTQQPIRDGQVFEVEGATVRAVHAPGHSHDHMCFILEEEQAMFTGDNVLGHGTAAVEHLGTWMQSLRTMKSHGCTVGYPAHGVVVPNLSQKIDQELACKVRRERQVLQALRGAGQGGRITVEELVTKVYGENLDEGIRGQALEPFMDEVLRKLAEDGRVGFQVRGGLKKWFSVE
ncbi:beta-lactamase-like protein [Lasiosphaeris hirsuta]|uniref:Beta-lactamase-like protein n=1 Tax=Lasiosphaeris hirsuta TaxID=260670 RepID=A0AA40E619_9PEZI|nr:beta-lactamase-like protein [Lasiosphaeris hirsuta]